MVLDLNFPVLEEQWKTICIKSSYSWQTSGQVCWLYSRGSSPLTDKQWEWLAIQCATLEPEHDFDFLKGVTSTYELQRLRLVGLKTIATHCQSRDTLLQSRSKFMVFSFTNVKVFYWKQIQRILKCLQEKQYTDAFAGSHFRWQQMKGSRLLYEYPGRQYACPHQSLVMMTILTLNL